MSDYYQTCAFPKPSATKKKKLQNGYKDKEKRICWYCGERCAERHEVFNGPNRQKSIEMGFQVDVCAMHHRMLHESASEFSKIETMKWRMYYQKKYEESVQEKSEQAINAEQARQLWMLMIGKNYL